MVYIQLTQQEEATLQQMELATTSKALRDRIQCILLSAKEVQVKELSVFFDVVPKTIYQWLTKYRQQGPAGLIHKGGTGRKAKLRNISPQLIKEMVDHSPQNLKPVLSRLQEEQQVRVIMNALIMGAGHRIFDNMNVTDDNLTDQQKKYNN